MFRQTGLKAREEMLEQLRFLFRNESELIREGWYSEAEFLEAVIETVLEAIAKQFKE